METLWWLVTLWLIAGVVILGWALLTTNIKQLQAEYGRLNGGKAIFIGSLIVVLLGPGLVAALIVMYVYQEWRQHNEERAQCLRSRLCV